MNLYDIVLALPLIGFLITLALPADSAKKFAFGFAILVFIASLGLIPGVLANPAVYSYETDVQWIAHPNIRYHVAIDGVSLWLIVLSTLLTPIAVLISWNYISKRPKEFYAFLLLLEFGVIGVFAALYAVRILALHLFDQRLQLGELLIRDPHCSHGAGFAFDRSAGFE